MRIYQYRPTEQNTNCKFSQSPIGKRKYCTHTKIHILYRKFYGTESVKFCLFPPFVLTGTESRFFFSPLYHQYNQPILPHTYSLHCPGQKLPAHQPRIQLQRTDSPAPDLHHPTTGDKINLTVLYHRTPKFTSRSKLKEELEFDNT